MTWMRLRSSSKLPALSLLTIPLRIFVDYSVQRSQTRSKLLSKERRVTVRDRYERPAKSDRPGRAGTREGVKRSHERSEIGAFPERNNLRDLDVAADRKNTVRQLNRLIQFLDGALYRRFSNDAARVTSWIAEAAPGGVDEQSVTGS